VARSFCTIAVASASGAILTSSAAGVGAGAMTTAAAMVMGVRDRDDIGISFRPEDAAIGGDGRDYSIRPPGFSAGRGRCAPQASGLQHTEASQETVTTAAERR